MRIPFIAMLLCLLTLASCEEKVELVKIKTRFGDILLYLYDETPKHKANFMKLAKQGFFDGTTFHRIIQGFMIQGGDPNSRDNDPNNDGMGGPPYTGEEGTHPDPENRNVYAIDAEIKPHLYHKKGVIAAARTGDQINPEKRSSGSQFYIVQGRVYSHEELEQYAQRRGLKINDDQRRLYTTVGGTPHLDGAYTVFGEVVAGMNVVDSIAAQPKGGADRPLSDIKMEVEVIKAKPKQLMKKYGYKVPQVQAK